MKPKGPSHAAKGPIRWSQRAHPMEPKGHLMELNDLFDATKGPIGWCQRAHRMDTKGPSKGAKGPIRRSQRTYLMEPKGPSNRAKGPIRWSQRAHPIEPKGLFDRPAGPIQLNQRAPPQRQKKWKFAGQQTFTRQKFPDFKKVRKLKIFDEKRAYLKFCDKNVRKLKNLTQKG